MIIYIKTLRDRPKVILHHGDLTDATAMLRIIQEIQPDEIYNLAAQSHVAVSFEQPEYTANSDALGMPQNFRSNSDFKITKQNKILSNFNV